MSLESLTTTMLPAIESELKRQVRRLDQPRTKLFHDMLTYHMGWSGAGVGPEATGKRIRPLLVLLVVTAGGEEWLRAVSAASAIELIHNFSLVHDDIQDHSDQRRGRETVWKIWGMPMAINVGDAMFVIANLAMMDLIDHYPSDIVVRVTKVLHDSCLDLTCGQFLDMSYENQSDLDIEDYWPMIQGKTSALLAACTKIGAILGKANEDATENFYQFGRHLGLAFQVQDDFLGIWGNEALTGKSTASDLVNGKKTLPVLYGIQHKGKFAKRWTQEPIHSEEVASIAQLLVDEGAREYTLHEAQRLSDLALEYLSRAIPRQADKAELVDLVNKLLHRTK